MESNFGDFSPTKKALFVLADLGVSSPQIDNPERGFSFKNNGPIDMRMNPLQKTTASKIIEELNEQDLANLIYKYGEERLSRRISRKIKKDLQEKGPYKGTEELAYAIAGCYPKRTRYNKLHPATRTFQALRIEVNKEMEALDSLLEKAPQWLENNGQINIISFHSLEDRKVKQSFKADQRLKVVTKKPIIPSDEELKKNPRSKSAKLRIARKL